MSNLLSLSPAGIPDDAREVAGARKRDSRARALAGALVVNDVVARLEKQDVGAIVLKGAAVAVTGYGDQSLRTSGDIDLLVRPYDLQKARDVLLDDGYAREYDQAAEQILVAGGHALEFSRAGPKVELHHRLFPDYLAVDLPEDEMWDSSRTIDCAGGRIRIPSPELQLLYVCVHGAKHCWRQFRSICDTAQLASRLDASEKSRLLAIARSHRLERIVQLAHYLAVETVHLEAEALPQGMARPTARALRLFGDVRENHFRDAERVELFAWATRIDSVLGPLVFWINTRESWADKIRCVARAVASPTASDGMSSKSGMIRRGGRLARRALLRSRGIK